MSIAIWCNDEWARDGLGSGRAHMLAVLVRDLGLKAEVVASVKPHPFAVHVMLEFDLDIRGIESMDEPPENAEVWAIGSDCPWPTTQSLDFDDPLELFDESYNDERVHRFREVRQALVAWVSSSFQI